MSVDFLDGTQIVMVAAISAGGKQTSVRSAHGD